MALLTLTNFICTYSSEASNKREKQTKKTTRIDIKTQFQINAKVCSNPVSSDPDIDASSEVKIGTAEITIKKSQTLAKEKLGVILWTELAHSQPASGTHITSEPWKFKAEDGKEYTVENLCFAPNQRDIDCISEQMKTFVRSQTFADYLAKPETSPWNTIGIHYFPNLTGDESALISQGFHRQWVFQHGTILITSGMDKSGKCVISSR